MSDSLKTSSTNSNQHQIRDEIKGVLIFVGVIWVIHVLDIFLPLGEYLALVPRYLSGIPGIGAMTFLHADFGHLIANTFPLIVLLTLLAGSRANSWQTVASFAVLGGLLLWLFGRNGNDTQIVSHVGASLLVFGLVTFFLAAAWFEKRLVPMLIAAVVGFMYGWSTLTGMLPIARGVSWDGHLCGAIAGVMVAWLQTGLSTSRDTFSSPPSA